MLSEAIGGLLPAAAAVALSPVPIIAVVLVLGASRARTAGPAFAAGWVLGLAVVSVLVVVVAGGASDPDSSAATGVNWLQVALGVLFLVMAAKQWRKRPRDGEAPDMPGWMATLDSVAPPKAFVLGAALSGANPKNLALTVAASASIAQAGLDGTDELLAVAAFVALGSVTVVGSVLFYLVAPTRATPPLAAVREFMTQNNATIMMVILVILGAKLVGDGLGGALS